MKKLSFSNPLFCINLLFFCLWIGYVCWFNWQLDLSFGDCVRYFRFKALNSDYLLHRYNTWTSRLLIESVLLPMAHSENLFRLVNSCVMALMPLLIWQLFPAGKIRRHLWLTIFLVSLYQINNMSTAGWRATVVNYYFPAAAGLLALRLRGETRPLLYLLLCPLLLFACNQEQSCFILTALFALHLRTENAHRSPLQYLPLLLCILSLFFTLTAPGNDARMFASTVKFEPGYLYYSFLYKAYVGFAETALHYFFNFQPIYLAFALALLFASRRQSEGREQYLLFPAFAVAVQPLALLLFNHSHRHFLLAPADISVPGLWLQFLLAMTLFPGLLYFLFYAFDDPRKGRFAAILFSLGAVSKFMLGLSPSVYNSVLRTAIFCDLVFIILTLMLIDETGFFKNRRLQSWGPPAALLITVIVYFLNPSLDKLQ